MTSACPFVFRQTPTDRLPHCFGAKLMRPSSRWVFSQPMVRWLGREDSNFHITIPKNAFEMSTEFLLIWPKIRLGDFCSFELCAEQTHQWVRRNASLGRSTSVLANSGHKSPV
jgi:hypothetical protein